MSSHTASRSDFTRGYTIALVSAFILSTTAILIRHLTQTYALPALVLAFWRDLFVFCSLLPVLWLLRRNLLQLMHRHRGYLVIYGLVLAIFNSLWTLSVALNGAAVATVLAYCSAGFTALLGWWFLKERLDWAKLLAVALSLGGCLLVSGALNPEAWRTNLAGILTGILSGLLYAIYSLMGRSAAQRGLNPWTTLLYTFGFAACFLLFFNLFSRGALPGTVKQPSDFFWLGDSLAGWGVLFLLGAVPTLAGFGLYNVSLSYLPSSVANLVVTLEPAFTAIIAYFAFGERLNAMQIFGSIMILAGVVFLRIHEGSVSNWRKQNFPENAPARFSQLSGVINQDDLAAGMRRLGLCRGDAVEVHSSLSSLGQVDGGAAAVIQALLEVVGEEGAVVMSAYPVTLPLPLTEAEYDRGIIAKVRFLDENSAERTGMGVIADTFRGWPGTVLGQGPHRVCAWGRDAAFHSQGYQHLLELDGWVLLIGVDIHRCSSMHLAEEPEMWPQRIKDYFCLPDDLLRDYPPDQWYVQYNDPPEDAWGKVQAKAEQRGLVRRGRIGQAECLLFKARPVVKIYSTWLREDPWGLFGIFPNEAAERGRAK